MVCPKDVARLVMYCSKLRFRQALVIGFLFVGGAAVNCTNAKSKESTSVSATIIVNLVGRIDIPLKDREGVDSKSEFEILSSATKIFQDAFQFGAPVIFVRVFHPGSEKCNCSLDVMKSTRQE